MTTDEELKAGVIAELARDPGLAGSEIGVIVKDAVVSILGHVGTVAQKEAVERAVRGVSGLCGAAFELDAKSEFGHKPSDTEIVHAALAALHANPHLSASSVKVEVENGWMTLSGELKGHFEVDIARQCVGPLSGVRGVFSCISIPPNVGLPTQELPNQAARPVGRLRTQ